MMQYFSDREHGQGAQTVTELTHSAWRGLRSMVRAGIDDGSFGARFPAICPDGAVPYGTNELQFWDAMAGEIPALSDTEYLLNQEDPPPTADVLDMMQFCWRSVGFPAKLGYHDWRTHFHLNFDVDRGRNEFRDKANEILRRNKLAYTLNEDGNFERVLPPEIEQSLRPTYFHSGDDDLDQMLESARSKIYDPHEQVRREALEKLWDAWERLKTLGVGGDKKAQVRSLLDTTAGNTSPKFREALEREAKELTSVGNNLQIRHSETDQERLSSGIHVDYLFYRMFALVHSILRSKKWA